MKKIFLVLLLISLFYPYALSDNAESAGEAKVIKSTQPLRTESAANNEESPADEKNIADNQKECPDISGLQNAILELNTKITSVKVSQTELANKLNFFDIELNKYKTRLSELDLKSVKLEEIKKMETELSLLRSEISQLRENMGVLKSENKRNGKKALRKWYQAEWVNPASLGISVVALLIAL